MIAIHWREKTINHGALGNVNAAQLRCIVWKQFTTCICEFWLVLGLHVQIHTRTVHVTHRVHKGTHSMLMSSVVESESCVISIGIYYGLRTGGRYCTCAGQMLHVHSLDGSIFCLKWRHGRVLNVLRRHEWDSIGRCVGYLLAKFHTNFTPIRFETTEP